MMESTRRSHQWLENSGGAAYIVPSTTHFVKLCVLMSGSSTGGDDASPSGCALVTKLVRSRHFELRFATGFETELKLNCLSAVANAAGGDPAGEGVKGAAKSVTPAVAFRRRGTGTTG